MIRTLLLVLFSFLPLSCAHAGELIVSAAASLTNAFRDAGKLFEKNNPGEKVVLNFASSNVLLSQIAKGAPADVFATADAETMDRAEKQGLLAPGTRRTLLNNKLVLIVPAGAKAKPSGLPGLEDEVIHRIAIGNPASVPAGRYARDALQKAGLWSKLEPKYVLAQNVRQALDYVARAEADAGIVYSTDAAIMAGKVVVAAEIPLDRPIVYPVAIVKGTRNRASAESFLRSLGSPQTQAIFTRHGFSQPQAPGS
ncbi:MAG: molybdate ABC transporter substrate-binding protein [Betaproteobacteria bacterium]|nr:molybdate ABC transporter substrate-binding protein [Betaproteobacteria bacterium]